MAAPVNTVAPVITGSFVLNGTVTVNTGTWTDDGTGVKTYQWQKAPNDGLNTYASIGGATSSSLVLSSSLLGYKIRCQVTDTDGVGATTANTGVPFTAVYYPWPLDPPPAYYSKSNWLQAGYNRNGIFYQGDTVVIPRDVIYHATDPATADFEKGTNGVAIASSDAGSFTPLSVFGTAPAYDNTHASGTLAMKVSATGKVEHFANIPLDGKTHHGRARMYATANPSSSTMVVELTALSNASPQILLIYINTTGHIFFDSTPGRTTFSTAIPLNQFFRIEWGIVNDSGGAGSIEIRLYTGTNDSSPAETKTVTGLTNQDVSVHGIVTDYGIMDGSWGTPFWMDDLVTNAAGWVGPGAVTFPAFTHQYEVRDFYGTVVSSGSFTEPECRPTPPLGGWTPGWYRVYFTGDQTDTLFGTSYGATQFAVIRTDSHFVTNPAGTTAGGTDTTSDFVMKGVLGLGTSRIAVPDVTNLAGSSYPIASAISDAAIAATYWVNPGAPYADANRPRYQWVNFPGQTWDILPIVNGSAGSWGWVTCKDGTVDGGNLYVTVTAGSVSGTKIKAFYPNNTTLVETFDNLASAAAAATAINGVSSYIVFVNNDGGTPTLISTPTAVGNTYFNGVKSAVTSLYAAGITYFEGPTNEPALDSAKDGARTTQLMRLFQAAVHAGNASAKAIGPCHVDINATKIGYFLAAGGGAYCDEFSFHAYNSVNGDINIGTAQLAALNAVLASYGYASKTKWQTESTQGSSAISTHVPHKNVRWYLWNTLMLEQYGFARERNNPWYDKSSGFWSFPAFLRTSDGALTPQAVVGRVLAEETWGKPYSSALDFGTIGNRMFLGSIYTNPSTGSSVAVLYPTSPMSNGKVTLSVTGGASTLTVIDGFGNSSVVSVTAGLAAFDVTELPVYVRLPAGVAATVHSCNDWASTSLTEVTTSTATVGATSTAKPIDNTWMASYDGSAGNAYESPNALPENITIALSSSHSVGRVVVWSGFAWQSHTALVKFDVQTSTDGVTFTTRETVDASASATSFAFGTSTTNTGSVYETYWPEQWVFDVSFDAVTATHVRLAVQQTSYGGMPDHQSVAGPFNNFGVGTPNQYITVQEVKVFSDGPAAGGGWTVGVSF